MKPIALLTLCAMALMLSGCGPTAPPPAKGPVKESEVLYQWRYKADIEETTVEIEFLSDHTFEQIVMSSRGARKTQHGTWQLKGAHLILKNVLINHSFSGFVITEWKPAAEVAWLFTDQEGYPQLYGGDKLDPDTFVCLRKARTARTPPPSSTVGE